MFVKNGSYKVEIEQQILSHIKHLKNVVKKNIGQLLRCCKLEVSSKGVFINDVTQVGGVGSVHL